MIAGNVDGSWNQTGAAFGFYLSPHFYQTRAFWVAIGSGAILPGWLLYRLRVHELKARYTAVLAERNRISQDIHDTFAQNLAGIALQLDSMVASAKVEKSVQVIGTPHRLSSVTEKNLMRIFQEAMANALKHSEARAIHIELRYEKEALALRVRDAASDSTPSGRFPWRWANTG